jgi:hypothetical protein
VADLCSAADVVLFSAAIPGQGGPGSEEHPNEQWQSYWAQLFVDAGYHAFDAIRPAIWTDRRIAFWYRQNAFLAVAPSCTSTINGPSSVHDVVHPELWEYVNAQLWARRASIRDLARQLPRALDLAVRRRLTRSS